MNTEIAVSIINYRTPEMTISCARSVLEDMDGLDAQIVIVDNASGDGSVETIADWIAREDAAASVRLIRSPENTGFSGGHNQTIRSVEAEAYLLLNSDAILRPGFLGRILEAARADPEAGFVVPRLVGEDGAIQTNCFRFHSLLSEFERGANTGPVTRLLSRHLVSLGEDPDPDETEWASFACILLDGVMVREIGPMDEGYFLYFEDAEYCLRGRRAGWKIRHAPEAVAVHFRGGSGPVKALARARKRLPRYYYSSRTRFFYQRYGVVGPWAANLLWTLGHGIAQVRRLAGRRTNNVIAAEWRDVWTNAFHPTGPRHGPGA
jgi:hypothetical protein